MPYKVEQFCADTMENCVENCAVTTENCADGLAYWPAVIAKPLDRDYQMTSRHDTHVREGDTSLHHLGHVDPLNSLHR